MPSTLRRCAAGLGVVVLVGLGVGCVTSAPATAVGSQTVTTQTVTAQAAYECKGSAAGAPSTTDTVSVQVQLAVPTSVAPGDTVTLRGSLKMQYSEQLRQTATALGVDTIDAYSTTLSTYRTLAGAAAPFFAERWQTGPTPLSNPMEASGALSFPAFTVPADATGELRLQLPQNGTTANITSNDPPEVAFSAYVKASGPGGTFNAVQSCYLTSTNPAVIATIPITVPSDATSATGAAAGSGGRAGSKPGAGAASATGSRGAAASTGTTEATGPAAGSAGTTTAQQSTVPVVAAAPAPAGAQGGLGAGIQPGSAAQDAAQDAGQDPPDDAGGQPVATAPEVSATYPVAGPLTAGSSNGIYVPTGLLVLGAAAFCLVTLGYAALTTLRIRNIRRSKD